MSHAAELIQDIAKLRKAMSVATPGPWFVRAAEDDYTCGATYISTEASDAVEWVAGEKIVAITYLQNAAPTRATASGQNEDFIVLARDIVPRLCDGLELALHRIDELRSANQGAEQHERLPGQDFSQGERGKDAARFAEGTNVVLLDADVAMAFPDSKSVNDALRTLVKSR